MGNFLCQPILVLRVLDALIVFPVFKGCINERRASFYFYGQLQKLLSGEKIRLDMPSIVDYDCDKNMQI